MPSKIAHMDEQLSVGSPPLEDRQSSATPSTSPYGTQDMVQTYTSVSPYSSYSVPAYDSSLPTPISLAGSPAMSERGSKMLPTYNEQDGDSHELTPPTVSRPWSYASSMVATSSASMPAPGAAGMIDMNLESSHSPEHHAAVVDPAPQFHWSTYGVSSHDPTDELSPPPLPSQPLYSSVPPAILIRSPSYGLPPGSDVPLVETMSQVPMPTHSADGRPLMQHGLHNFDNLSNISLEYGQAYPSRKSAKARANRSRRQSKRDRNTQQASAKNDYGNGVADGSAPGASHDLANHDPPKHLTLDAKAPEDSRYLVQMRCQLSDDKGKGMWDHIQQAYKERYGRKTKENLQMQLIRSVQSYAVWPEEEDQALKAAVEEYERRRYQEIRKIMKEKGGRRVWDWNDGSIAKRLVQMGVDEIDDRDATKITRRKRKSTVRQKSGGEPWVGCVNIQYSNELRELTAEEDEMLVQAFCKPEPDTDQDMLDQPASSSANMGNTENYQGRSARVAKQACDEMIAEQNENLYRGQSRYMA
ncbi:hypothetical protein F4777DRAFT_511460 [Nemania sp. FL0916]|nr:hypothetical protein F4777DRAFT_511460 [Nemania sp. FL0916]